MRRMMKLMVAGVLGVSGLAFVGGSADAAQPPEYRPGPGPFPRPNPGPFPPPRYDVDYVVYVKSPWSGHWRYYGRFETLHEARRVEYRLEREGYYVKVEPVRDGRGW
jgi:hypothetical protein